MTDAEAPRLLDAATEIEEHAPPRTWGDDVALGIRVLFGLLLLWG